MGNICRSPLAEGIARVALHDAGLALRLDSAGTHDYHVGAPPDERARRVAREIDCGIDDLRARQVSARDFSGFDLILAADRANLAWLRQQHPATVHAELDLLLPWCGAAAGTEVPDPYYGNLSDFRQVAAMLREAMPNLIARLRDRA
jgi:protein-tyrosine phosphatase